MTEKSARKTAARRKPAEKPSARKLGNSSSATRNRLLDACEKLMREHGYAAVTTRRLGEEAGVTPPLVHYYFKSMDDLFVSLYRERAEVELARIRQALDTERFLDALWQQSRDPIDAVLHMEFLALANHRKVVMNEMVKYGEQLRVIQKQALENYIATHHIELSIDVEALIVLMAGTGLLLALESRNGMSFGHEQIRQYIAGLISANSGNEVS